MFGIEPFQERQIEIADRDHMVCGPDQISKHLKVHFLMEDVLGMGGEGERNAGQLGRNLGGAGGNRSEVGMEVGDAALRQQGGEFNTLMHLNRIQPSKVRKQPGKPFSEAWHR